MKPIKTLIDILNNKNLNSLQKLHLDASHQVILLSKLELETLSRKNLFLIKDTIQNNKIIFIPSVNNYIVMNRLKRNLELTLVMDWFLSLQSSINIVMKNDTLLFASNKSVDWQKTYDGSMGYGITAHDEQLPLLYHRYGASINNMTDMFSFVVFDGLFLRKTDSNK